MTSFLELPIVPRPNFLRFRTRFKTTTMKSGTERIALLLTTLAILHTSVLADEGCANSKNTLGRIEPSHDVVLLYGQSLDLKCILNTTGHPNLSGYNSSHLVFYRGADPVDSSFQTIVDARTLRMHIPRPAMSESVYYCKLKPDHLNVCLIQVTVGTPPTEVDNFKCLSQNWENLTCTWLPKNNFLKTDYTLLFRVGKGRSMGYSCPNVTMETTTYEYECFISLSTTPLYRQTAPYYYFTLIGSNTLGSHSQNMTLDHFANIRPNPVNLTLHSRSAHAAHLNWSLPFPLINFSGRLVYRVRYYDDVDKTWYNSSVEPVPRGTPPLNLTGLAYAYRYYTVRVSIKTEKAADNMWSDETPVIFRTDSELPSRAPDTDMGGFEIISSNTHRSVRIYWRQIREDEENGENFLYRVEVHLEGMRIALDYSETKKGYFNYSNLPNKPLEFFVMSVNNVGQSHNKSRLIIPDQHHIIAEPSSFTKAALGKGAYKLSWGAPDVNLTTLQSYTIFWCDNVRDRPYQCEGRLQWETIPATLTTHNFTVPDDKIYQFAISANGYGTSSGMVWASCTIIPNMDFGKIRDLWIITVDSTFIEIGWKLECPDNLGIVIGYQVYYCPIVGLHNTDCREPLLTSIIPGGNTMRANITGLRPYTTYNIQVAIEVGNEVGRKSDPLLSTLREGAPSPPAPPRVANLSNRLALISWDPPMTDNGVLTYYKMSYRLIPLPDEIPEPLWIDHKVDVIGKARELKLNNLQSYANYSVRVQACTVTCSLPSEEVHFRTAIGTPGAPGRPDVTLLNQLHHLVWEPPLLPGGTLDLYEVRMVKVAKNSNSTITYNTTDTELLILEPSCQEPGVLAHIYSVRAINYDAAHDHGAIALSHFNHVSVDCRKPGDEPITFWGPWSPSTENTCTPAHTDASFAWIMGITGLVILLAALVAGGKWAWRKIDNMRSIKPSLPEGFTGLDTDVKQPLDARIMPPPKGDRLGPSGPADEVSLLGAVPSSPGVRDTSGFSATTTSTSLSGGSSRRAPSPDWPVTTTYSTVGQAPEDSESTPTNTDTPYVTFAAEIPKRNPEPLSNGYVQVASLTPKETLTEPPSSLPLTYVQAAPEMRPPPVFSPYVAVDDPRLTVAPPAPPPRAPPSGYVLHESMMPPKRTSVPPLLNKVSEDKRGSLFMEPTFRSSEYCRFGWDQERDSLTPAAAPPEE